MELSDDKVEALIDLLQKQNEQFRSKIAQQEIHIWKLEHPKGYICPITGHRHDPEEIKRAASIFKEPYKKSRKKKTK